MKDKSKENAIWVYRNIKDVKLTVIFTCSFSFGAFLKTWLPFTILVAGIVLLVVLL